MFVPAVAAAEVPHAGQSMSLLILVPHAGHGWWVVPGSFLSLSFVRVGFRFLGHEFALLNTADSSRSPPEVPASFSASWLGRVPVD